MFPCLPAGAVEFAAWSWEQIQPYYADLLARELTPETIPQWLADRSHLKALVFEALARLDRLTASNTADREAQGHRYRYFSTVFQPAWAIDQQLRERWLDSALVPPRPWDADGPPADRKNVALRGQPASGSSGAGADGTI